jgi:hypothetical protein
LFIIGIYSSGSIEAYKIIIVGARLEFENHRNVVCMLVVSDSYQGHHRFPTGWSRKQRQHHFAIIVPTNLPVLGWVIAHFANVILVERISL